MKLTNVRPYYVILEKRAKKAVPKGECPLADQDEQTASIEHKYKTNKYVKKRRLKNANSKAGQDLQ